MRRHHAAIAKALERLVHGVFGDGLHRMEGGKRELATTEDRFHRPEDLKRLP